MAQFGPLEGKFLEFFKLTKIAMVQVWCFYVFVLGYVSISFMHVLVLMWMMIPCLFCFISFTVHGFGNLDNERVFSNVFVLEEQTPQPNDGALASCYNHACTKHYTLTSFPYKEVVPDWRACKPKWGRYALSV